MLRFIKLIIGFSILPILLFVLVEYSARQNSYQVKADYIAKHKNEVKLMVLGASHSYRAINPAFLDFPTALLAQNGVEIQLSSLLYEHFEPQLPNLKYVIIDVCYPILEFRREREQTNNHLIFNHYGVKNYEGKIPLRDYFLFTAEPRTYLDKLLFPNSPKYFRELNEFGFIIKSNSLFEKINFDAVKAEEESKSMHQKEDVEHYKENVQILNKIIDDCLKKEYKVILLAPPNYHVYNDKMNPNILRRRNECLEKYKRVENVFVWNFEKKYEKELTYFLNQNHMNPKGAEIFTKELNTRLKNM